TTGTVTGVTALIGLPNGTSVKSDVGNITTGLGHITRHAASNQSLRPLITGGDTWFEISVFDNAASINAMIPAVASTYFGSTEAVSFYVSIPIEGLDANPKPLLAFPTITYGQNAENYRASGSNGHGSTNTKIRVFNSVDTNNISNTGTATQDSTSGFSFTASTRCTVYCSYTDKKSSAGDAVLGLSLNSNQLTTSIGGITATHRLVAEYVDGNDDVLSTVAWSGIMEAGDVLRPHGDGGLDASATECSFSLLVIPEEGQVNQAAIISQPVAFVKDVKASGTDGGTFTSGAWQTRDLTQLSGDIAAVGVTLSSNQFTLPAGKYVIEAKAHSYNVTYNKSARNNITDSKNVEKGKEEYSDADN
ncbi:hypothetical protein, partial [Nocardia mangyaensis]|uniref:hypothetical protein n=1 Tax=Nocardia mangyaensis TaxID=2213200 RepID=UPI0026770EC7